MQIAEILEKTGQTETMVLREHAILTIHTKLSRYESECALFEKKYGVSLESFRNRLEQKMNSESFMEGANCKTKNSLVTDNAQTTAITSNLGQN